MQQGLQTRASKYFGGALTGIMALGVVTFWAAVAAFAWQASKPYRVAAVELWELIPAGSRPEIGLGLAVVGGVLLILVVIAGIVGKGEPARYSGVSPETYVNVDVDLDVVDIDVSGM